MSIPPGPPGPALTHILQWIARPTQFMEECAARYGETFTFRFPQWGPVVMLSNPEHIKQVFTGDPDVLHAGEGNALLAPVLGSSSLIVIDGAKHLRTRRLLLPPFHGERMQRYGLAMRDVTDRSIDQWTPGSPFSLHPTFQNVTLEIIVRTVFGVEDASRMKTLSDRLSAFATLGNSPLLFLAPLQRDLGPWSPWGKVLRELKATDAVLREEITRRRAAADLASRDDVLSMLLQVRDEDGRGLSDDELCDQLVTLLVAGHETTATALCWTFERLLTHPTVLTKTLDELHTVVGQGPLSPEHLPKLPYLEAVIKETLRLRPIIPVVARVLKAPMEIAGYTLARGTTVMPSIWLTQRREDIYPSALMFRPERFIDAKLDPYAWLPFGGGIRRCIGMAFALFEMKTILATTLLRCRMHLTSDKPAKLVRRGITFAPQHGPEVILDARSPLKVSKLVSAEPVNRPTQGE